MLWPDEAAFYVYLPYLTKLGMAVLILAAFWLAAKISVRVIHKLGEKSLPDRPSVYRLAGNLSRTGFIIFGAITAMGTLGIDISAMVAGLGLTGFAMGFAFKDALSNILAGVLILVHQPFRVKDRITAAGKSGKVEEINLRYTILQGKGEKYLIPNSSLFTNAITLHEDKKPKNT